MPTANGDDGGIGSGALAGIIVAAVVVGVLICVVVVKKRTGPGSAGAPRTDAGVENPTYDKSNAAAKDGFGFDAGDGYLEVASKK